MTRQNPTTKVGTTRPFRAPQRSQLRELLRPAWLSGAKTTGIAGEVAQVGLELRGAHEALGSDTTFAQAIAQAKWIHSTERGQRFLFSNALPPKRACHFATASVL
jgi:hypothetical protein